MCVVQIRIGPRHSCAKGKRAIVYNRGFQGAKYIASSRSTFYSINRRLLSIKITEIQITRESNGQYAMAACTVGPYAAHVHISHSKIRALIASWKPPPPFSPSALRYNHKKRIQFIKNLKKERKKETLSFSLCPMRFLKHQLL
jgi:hypothetical protein